VDGFSSKILPLGRGDPSLSAVSLHRCLRMNEWRPGSSHSLLQMIEFRGMHSKIRKEGKESLVRFFDSLYDQLFITILCGSIGDLSSRTQPLPKIKKRVGAKHKTKRNEGILIE